MDRRHSVLSRSEALRNIGTELAVVGRGVQTLEERKVERVEGLGVVKVLHLLDNNTARSEGQFGIQLMGTGDGLLGMCDQDALPVDLLGCRKVAAILVSELSSANAMGRRRRRVGRYALLLSIREETSVHVLDRNRGSEGLVRRNGVKVLRVGELGRRHLGLCNNVTHGDWVAGTRFDLFAVRDGLSRAEIDAGERESETWPIDKGIRQTRQKRDTDKLLTDVREATCPATGGFWPS